MPPLEPFAFAFLDAVGVGAVEKFLAQVAQLAGVQRRGGPRGGTWMGGPVRGGIAAVRVWLRAVRSGVWARLGVCVRLAAAVRSGVCVCRGAWARRVREGFAGERQHLLLGDLRRPRVRDLRGGAADHVRGVEGDLAGHEGLFGGRQGPQGPAGGDQFPGPPGGPAAAMSQERGRGGIPGLRCAVHRIDRGGQPGQLPLGPVDEPGQVTHLAEQRHRIRAGAEGGQAGQHLLPRGHSRGTHNRIIP